MSLKYSWLVWLFLILCLAFSLVGAFQVIPTKLNKNNSRRKKLIFCMLFLLIAVAMNRFAVGVFGYWNDKGIVETIGSNGLNILDEIFNSIIHALQTFSLDESYTEYISAGKTMMKTLTGSIYWAWVYACYSALLNLGAVVAGGAILLEILTSILPELRFVHCAKKKKAKFIFSELNEKSIKLAQSIRSSKHEELKDAILLFTDAYIEDGVEESAELYAAASEIKAICINDDILSIHQRLNGKVTVFLMDEDQASNAQTLISLAEKDLFMTSQDEILVFCTDDEFKPAEAYVQDRFRRRVIEDDPGLAQEDRAKELLKKITDIMPVIRPVNTTRNLIFNLMKQVPLYEPLVHDRIRLDSDKPQKLELSIIGFGSIGMEMLLTSYWCGQMLGVELKINVVSQEPESVFRSRLDRVNPDIMVSTREGNELLRAYDTSLTYSESPEDFNRPYCTINYLQADVGSGLFSDLLTSELSGTNYFVVTLGSDDLNITTAEFIKREVGRRNVEMEKTLETVIAYSVYDTEMCRAMNRRGCLDYSLEEGVDIYIRAFGSLESEFSEENILMLELTSEARDINDNYLDMSTSHSVARDCKEELKQKKDAQFARVKDNYNNLSSVCRALHLRYKLFSAGMIKKSLFDDLAQGRGYDEEREKYIAANDEALKRYTALVKSPSGDGDIALIHSLAWLEHRRWAAFMRSQGFRNHISESKYRTKVKANKHLELKLHPCLVESADWGRLRPLPSIDQASRSFKAVTIAPGEFAARKYDLLDKVSYEEEREPDCKLYDYPYMESLVLHN